MAPTKADTETVWGAYLRLSRLKFGSRKRVNAGAGSVTRTSRSNGNSS